MYILIWFSSLSPTSVSTILLFWMDLLFWDRLTNQSPSKILRKGGQTKANTQHTETISIFMMDTGVIPAKFQICLCNWRLPELPLRLCLLTSTALSAITFINNINTAIRSSVISLMPICLKIPLLATSYQPADKLNWHRLEKMFTQEM